LVSGGKVPVERGGGRRHKRLQRERKDHEGSPTTMREGKKEVC